MFEKEKCDTLYTREDFSIEEKLYESYIEMRKNMNKLENFKYDKEDKYMTSETFKQGFVAGVKIMSSLLIDL